MKKTIELIAFASVFALTGCSGGGGNTPQSTGSQADTSATATPATVPAAATTTEAPKTVILKSGLDVWFHTQSRNDDGSEDLMLSTIDGANVYNVTPATPMMMIRAGATGVTDVTNDYFQTVPAMYWARNLVSFRDDAGNPVLWICSQGREVGDYRSAPTPRVNGVWGEQDQLFVMQNGKYVNKSDLIPQVVDFSHGCTAAHTGTGKVDLVKNTLGDFGNYLSQYMMVSNGTSYGLDPDFSRADVSTPETGGSFQVAAADFTKTGQDDVVYGKAVVRRTASGYTTVQQLSAPDLEAAGYGTAHGNVVGDLNGDGYPDLVILFSGDGTKSISSLAGVKLAAFINDKAGHLVYTPNVFPAHGDTEFGLDGRIIDVNFDGLPDVVISGPRYVYSNTNNMPDFTASAVMINNADGTFTKKALVDVELNKQCAKQCQTATYFLKNADGSFNIVAKGMNAQNETILYSRKVTKEKPLTIQ